MKLTDEQGDIELTPELFVKLMQETMALMVAYTIEKHITREEKRVLNLTRRILNETRNNDEWMKKYIDFIYKKARQ